MILIDPSRDLAGLRIAAAELLEESFRAPELRQMLTESDADVVVEILTKMGKTRSVAEGYFLWIIYLFWLRDVTALDGVRLDLLAHEAEGLRVLAQATREFDATHPKCYRCGALNEQDAVCCQRCMASFSGAE